jgi:hypothetical protein
MMVLSTLSARFAELTAQANGVPVPADLSLDPTLNVIAKWPEWLFFFAIVFSVNLFIVERDRGTPPGRSRSRSRGRRCSPASGRPG